jgi:DNA-binding response OmpR family regulator
MRILLVDDDQLVLRALAAALRRELACEVASFSDPAAAVEHARGNGIPIDLAIVDRHMPGMTGEALIHALRCQRPDLKIMMLTGEHRPRDGSMCCPDALVHKPIDGSELAAQVRALAARAPGT